MSDVGPEVVRLKDQEHRSFVAIAATMGISKDAARRAYHRTKAGPRPTGAGPRSLVRFMRDKRREGCPVCALDPAVRQQLAEASTRKIPRAVQLEWLHAEVRTKVTADDLSQHVNGRHDAEAA